MDSDEGKIFVGRIQSLAWDNDENLLREHFSQFGEVFDVKVIRDKATGHNKGFGFITFSDPAVIDRVLQEKHHIDGREVYVARGMDRAGRTGNFDPNRIYVGGLPLSLTSEEFEAYFETYGPVSHAVIMTSQATQRPRGYGFVSFRSRKSVDRVLRETFHCLNGNRVEVKRAFPKGSNLGVASGGVEAGVFLGNGGGGVGAFPVYGGSGGSGYEGHKDSNRYMQPQNTGSDYPPYGAFRYCYPPYSASGYGHGSYGVDYGGYGWYGYPPYGASGYGHGSYGVGYYGYPAGMPYGNPGVLGASGPSSSRDAQEPSGYSNVEYGNASREGGSGPGSAVIEQVGGSADYVYGGNDFSYGPPSAYGAVEGGGSGSGSADASNGARGYGNGQRNNGQAGNGGSCGKGKQVQQ